MDKISKDKQYTTRDGREVRIYATDGAGEYSVHGALKSREGWIYTTWGSQGHIVNPCMEYPDDLIEVKPRIKFERWVVVEPDGGYALWVDKPNLAFRTNLFALKHISFEVEEGEGLEHGSN
jgi:hypothetical protein